MQIPDIKAVETFWDTHPCGMPETGDAEDRRSFFLGLEKQRYGKIPKLSSHCDFTSFRGKRVLEVGCGIGTDGVQFARNGALYTGVDLTGTAIKVAQERFLLFGLPGEIIKLNAETLPFPDNSFDHVYSFGVIHHSPYPEKIVAEIFRVLKPGGTVSAMLYNRTSFYYRIEVQGIRKIFFKVCDKKVLCRAVFSVFGKGLSARFEAFREKLAMMKARSGRPSQLEWVSMHTDHPFCPIARVYSAQEARKLFSAFRNFRTEVWFIDKDNWFLWLALVRFLPEAIINWLESRAGWFRMIKANK